MPTTPDPTKYISVDSPKGGWDNAQVVTVPPEQQETWTGPFGVAGWGPDPGGPENKANHWFRVQQNPGVAGVRYSGSWTNLGPMPGKDGGWPYGTLTYGVNGGPYHGWIINEVGHAFRPATVDEHRQIVTTGSASPGGAMVPSSGFSPQSMAGGMGWGLSQLDMADLAELLGQGIGALTAVPPPPPAVGLPGEPTGSDEKKNLANLIAYDLADAQHIQRDFQLRVGADVVAIVVQRRSTPGLQSIRLKDMVREAGPVIAALNSLPTPPPIIGERVKDWGNYFTWRDSLAKFFKRAEQLTAASLAASMVAPNR